MTIKQLFALIKSDLLRLSGYEYPNTAPISWKKIFNPRFFPVLLFRLGRYCYMSRWLRLLSPLFSWLNVIIFGIEITSRCEIGAGLMIPHSIGTVIGATKIGNNATIFQGVTLGAIQLDLTFDPALRPQLGDYVTIGAGAKVLGGIVISNHVTIGANAVVINSLAANTVAVGVPAKPL